MEKLHSGDIEIMIARHLNPRLNLIVPNVSWGLGSYEKDLLVLTPNGYAWEIEIKVSKSDLIADKKKTHGHYSNLIKRLYFAVPEYLEKDALLHIPERAGLFIITNPFTKNGKYIDSYVNLVKAPLINTKATKLSDKQIKKLYELSAMRLWSLKEVIYRLQRNKHD
jgi:hypothetical protein